MPSIRQIQPHHEIKHHAKQQDLPNFNRNIPRHFGRIINDRPIEHEPFMLVQNLSAVESPGDFGLRGECVE